MFKHMLLLFVLPVVGVFSQPAQARGLKQAQPLTSPSQDPAIDSGGAVPGQTAPKPRKKDLRARILANGLASIPQDAPPAVQKAIRAANQIIGKPYIYGGGHGSWRSSGYDCSGTVSYALHGGDFIRSPMASGDLMSWGVSGSGKWITVYANGGHAFAYLAGLRLDTSRAEDPGGSKGPRWRKLLSSTAGYTARHPRGL